MNIVFVVQRGELELKALLLAWSLRRSHGQALHLYAACPQYADWGEIDGRTRAALVRLNVQLLTFTPAFAPSYPIGNKLGLLGMLPPGEPALFLDSDMLSLGAWDPAALLGEDAVAAKAADMGTWGDEARWRKVYALAKLELPVRRVRLTVSDKLSLPYFNAGVVATREPSRFGKAWLEAAEVLHGCDLELGERFPWLDQIALPLAMMQQPSWRSLDECWNFPAHLRALGSKRVNLCHYHNPGVILREARLLGLFRKACAGVSHIKALASQYPQWNVLCQRQGAPIFLRQRRRDFLITGIPRSGTSLICSLLDQQLRCVVINEPKEIFDLVESRSDASGIELLHAQVREALYKGEPIVNKVQDGRVVSDTKILDERVLYHPQLASNDFWLGSKNTLVYLAALSRIRALGWPVLASVRHPLDSLASWRNTFDHLREANVESFAVANPTFGAWNSSQRIAMNEIACQSDSALRRVLLWRMLTRTLLDNADWLTLWRYEDFTGDIRGHLRRFNRSMGQRARIEPIAGRNLHRAKERDPLERSMLGDLCSAELRELNYEL